MNNTAFETNSRIWATVLWWFIQFSNMRIYFAWKISSIFYANPYSVLSISMKCNTFFILHSLFYGLFSCINNLFSLHSLILWSLHLKRNLVLYISTFSCLTVSYNFYFCFSLVSVCFDFASHDSLEFFISFHLNATQFHFVWR